MLKTKPKDAHFLPGSSWQIRAIPPIDNGIVGIRYIHNPGAFDPDGDSLSYELVIPLQDDFNEVTNYRFPNSFGNLWIYFVLY